MTKKILVIEDNAKHLADAKAFFADKPEYDVEYLVNGQQAIDCLKSGGAKRYTYVITDLFMPLSEGYPMEQPIGLGIFIMCKEQKVRCIINTAGYHHGQKYQWVHSLPGIIMRDSWGGDKEAEGETKHWGKCLEDLTWDGTVGVGANEWYC